MPKHRATAAVVRAAPAVASTSTAGPPSLHVYYDAQAAGGGKQYTEVPKSVHDGSVDYYRPWGERGDLWWQFKVKQAVAAVRGNARVGQAPPPSAQDPALRRVVSAAAMPTLGNTVYDVLEKRAHKLCNRIRDSEDRQHRERSAMELYRLTQGPEISEATVGIQQAARAMELMNRLGLDVDRCGQYSPGN